MPYFYDVGHILISYYWIYILSIPTKSESKKANIALCRRYFWKCDNVSHYHSFRRRWQQARWQCITSCIIWSLCDIDIVSHCDCFYTANSGTLKWWQSCVETALKIKIQSAGYWFGNQKLWIGAKLIKSISRSEAYFGVTIYQKFLKAYLSRVFTCFLLKYKLQSKIYWQIEIDILNTHRMESKTLREDQNWVRYSQVSKWLMVSKGVVNDCTLKGDCLFGTHTL